MAVVLALRDDRAQHVVQPRGREVEVDEARARRSRPARGARGGPGSSATTILAATSRGDMPDRLGELQRDVGGEVAVAGVLRRGQLDAVRRLGEAARVERGLDCGEELVTDHEVSGGGARRPSPLAVLAHGSGASAAPPRGVSRRSRADSPRVVRRRSSRAAVRSRYRRASEAGREGQCSTNESVVAAARDYGPRHRVPALDDLVDLYALDDAAVVVDVPGFGRQVLPRRPAPARATTSTALHTAEPGLYLDPPLDDPVLSRPHAGARHPRPAPRRRGHVPVVSIVSLDELELRAAPPRRRARGRVRGDRRPRAGRGAGRRRRLRRPRPRRHRARGRARAAGRSRSRSCGGVTAAPHQPESRLRLVEVTTDPGAVRSPCAWPAATRRPLGRASTAGGLPAAVEATVVRGPRVRARAPLPPGLGPHRRDHSRPAVPRGRVGHRPDHPHPPPRRRRGRHAHRGRRPRHPRRAQPHHQPRPCSAPTREVASLNAFIRGQSDATCAIRRGRGAP